MRAINGEREESRSKTEGAGEVNKYCSCRLVSVWWQHWRILRSVCCSWRSVLFFSRDKRKLNCWLTHIRIRILLRNVMFKVFYITFHLFTNVWNPKFLEMEARLKRKMKQNSLLKRWGVFTLYSRPADDNETAAQYTCLSPPFSFFFLPASVKTGNTGAGRIAQVVCRLTAAEKKIWERPAGERREELVTRPRLMWKWQCYCALLLWFLSFVLFLFEESKRKRNGWKRGRGWNWSWTKKLKSTRQMN